MSIELGKISIGRNRFVRTPGLSWVVISPSCHEWIHIFHIFTSWTFAIGSTPLISLKTAAFVVWALWLASATYWLRYEIDRYNIDRFYCRVSLETHSVTLLAANVVWYLANITCFFWVHSSHCYAVVLTVLSRSLCPTACKVHSWRFILRNVTWRRQIYSPVQHEVAHALITVRAQKMLVLFVWFSDWFVWFIDHQAGVIDWSWIWVFKVHGVRSTHSSVLIKVDWVLSDMMIKGYLDFHEAKIGEEDSRDFSISIESLSSCADINLLLV